MTLKRRLSISVASIGILMAALYVLPWMATAAEVPASASVVDVAASEAEFVNRVRPLLTEFCVRCHNPDNLKSGVRVDQLTASPEDKQLFLWEDIRKQVAANAMPPEDQPQPSAEQRKMLDAWIERAIATARSRNTQRNGSVRRLTVAQYRNTLKDLLGLEENLTEILPPDSLSKDGFVNNIQTLLLSPLQVESYFNIAEKALDLCIVDEAATPVIQNFRVELGTSINSQPCPDKLVLGANNELLNNPDFLVTELKPSKSFEYQPFSMRTHYDFIEGYVGNDTIRAWKTFDSIYHSVFACMRGTPGYPKGEAYQVVKNGLLLRPAIPSPEIFGQSNTYGPMANFKISLRELPDGGNFRITVKAARDNDALLLEAGAQVHTASGAESIEIPAPSSTAPAKLNVKTAGIYQVDVDLIPGTKLDSFKLTLGDRAFASQLGEQKPNAAVSDDANKTAQVSTALMLVRLERGEIDVSAQFGDNSRLCGLRFTPIADDSDLARRFSIFERRSPSLGIYLGLRRDCGSTLTQVGAPCPVETTELRDYVFEGAIKNYPNPDVEKDNVNYLAGIREIGVRSEYTDGRDMPRLLVRSVEFEGPYHETWPPLTHRRIFIESSQRSDSTAYAREVIQSFATRAFRRPVTAAELDALFAVWQKSYAENQNFQQSIKDALLVVLTAPQFLFLIENSSGPQAEDLDPYELAAKLSYTFWNTTPDSSLLERAARNELHVSLDAEFDRLLGDPRSGQFVNEFVSQWLSLEKFDVVSIDSKRYPRLTRDAKAQLRREPVEYVRYALEQNLPLRSLVQSDFVVANEVVANYYNLSDRTESGFRFVPIRHGNEHLGGVLTQASILAGLSDGRESNPIKRGAWLARKIVAEPPDDPPPNVPKIKDDDGTPLTFRQKLDRHRNQEGCVKCHSGIDPWGMPFEQFDASGMLKTAPGVDAHSTLPDGTEVNDLNGLKSYLAQDRIDQLAFGFLKHFASYATGRSLTYNEIAYLRERGIELKTEEYRLRDLLRFIVKSDLFLKK